MYLQNKHIYWFVKLYFDWACLFHSKLFNYYSNERNLTKSGVRYANLFKISNGIETVKYTNKNISGTKPKIIKYIYIYFFLKLVKYFPKIKKKRARYANDFIYSKEFDFYAIILI